MPDINCVVSKVSSTLYTLSKRRPRRGAHLLRRRERRAAAEAVREEAVLVHDPARLREALHGRLELVLDLVLVDLRSGSR